MSDGKTEVEFAGVKFRGGRMFAIILALSTLGGGLYGAFEFYKDYMNMKDKIEKYVAPDLSGFDKRLAILHEEIVALKEISAAHVEIIAVYGDKLDFMQNGVQMNESANRSMKNDMRSDLARIEGIVNKVEDDSAIEKNDIARIKVKTARPLMYDSYKKNRTTGAVILVDEFTNETVGAGMIL